MTKPKSKNTATVSDQPAKVTLTFESLRNEAAAPDPFVLQLPGGFVHFPDLFDREVEEGQKFIKELEEWGNSDLEFLEKWLEPKDFKVLKDAKLKMREQNLLMRKVITYYRDTMGTPGESNASAGS